MAFNRDDSLRNATRTDFSITVVDGEPHDFSFYTAQDMDVVVKITHLVYTPPTSREEWESFYQQRGRTPPSGGDHTVMSVSASLKALTLNNTIESFVIAAFPLSLSRLNQTPTPQPTDVVGGLRISLEVDDSVHLLVDGPGTVVFKGELTMIPVVDEFGSDSEDGQSDMNEEEMAEMFRLSRG